MECIYLLRSGVRRIIRVLSAEVKINRVQAEFNNLRLLMSSSQFSGELRRFSGSHRQASSQVEA